jgi:ferredoxin
VGKRGVGIMNKGINIVYYSGTGGTERVAKCFEMEFQKDGYNVALHRITVNSKFDLVKGEQLLLLYAVHASNAPDLVYKWIDSIEEVKDVTAAVVSVSGGGEIIPNTACRVKPIRKLEKKGYLVKYEKMFVMPSNVGVATKKPLAQILFEILPKNVRTGVDYIEGGTECRTKPFLVDRFFSGVGGLEKYGARSFGKRIKVSDVCTGCGWCVENCPAGNIKLYLGKPEFGGACHMCLGCIYGCPVKALEPGILKFLVIKEGYNLKKLENVKPPETQVDVDELAKGYLWSGLRKYIKEEGGLCRLK